MRRDKSVWLRLVHAERIFDFDEKPLKLNGNNRWIYYNKYLGHYN